MFTGRKFVPLPAMGLVVLAIAIARKFWMAHEAMQFVAKCSGQVSLDSLMNRAGFNSTLASFGKGPILVMFLNRHNLEMTLNWLCNTEHMEGVHSRLLLLTMDQIADGEMAQIWPKVSRLHVDIHCLHQPFNYGDGHYQLFFILRANIARALVELGIPFWMVQQDTFWRLNLLELCLEHGKSEDLLFDRADDGQSRLIAGGYFFGRPSPGSRAFFRQLATDLGRHYVPDNTWMTSLCAERRALAQCGFIPFRTVANWQWIHWARAGRGSTFLPSLIQFDGDTQLGGKLAKMRSFGFYFLKSDSQTCEPRAFQAANLIVESLADGHQNLTGISPVPSYSQWQFGVYQAIIGLLYKWPLTERLLNNFIFPNAHFFMLTI